MSYRENSVSHKLQIATASGSASSLVSRTRNLKAPIFANSLRCPSEGPPLLISAFVATVVRYVRSPARDPNSLLREYMKIVATYGTVT